MNKLVLLLSFFLAMAITYFVGLYVLPILKRRECVQAINKDGPTWHASKSRTPTMGGITFIFGIIVAAMTGYGLFVVYGDTDFSFNLSGILAGLFLAIGFGLVGFADDYLKVVRRQNLGLKAREKFVMQLAITCAYLLQTSLLNGRTNILVIPFYGQCNLGWFIYFIHAFIILGCVNGVNLTDGIDGLASSVTAIAAIGLLCLSLTMGNLSAALLSICLVGGCIGFLCWNFHPAKVMMGDIGALFLGGVVAAIAFSLGTPAALMFFGVIYVIETLSVIIQMGYYHFTKKRIFKMTPIHHHFELSGYDEIQINLLFMCVETIGCIMGILSVRNVF
ncbi:MAG: phospho-N-acetylmuramoyl-pentapeptide-transferase [Oscillospiraceae bacterium]|nr:phospho-N-acetylmuramoyl-pentapeptide-transferase [Oscillospiraceae bacterium]